MENSKCSDFEAANLKEAEPEMNQDEPLPVIIDLSRVVDIDFTAAVVRIVHWFDRKWRHMNFEYKYSQTRLKPNHGNNKRIKTQFFPLKMCLL